MVSKANSIYEEFIRSEAPKEVKKKKKGRVFQIRVDTNYCWTVTFAIPPKKFPRLTMLD